MKKHKLKIHDHPLWPDMVIFKCDNCPKHISVSRGWTRAWTLGRVNMHLDSRPDWLVCSGPV